MRLRRVVSLSAFLSFSVMVLTGVVLFICRAVCQRQRGNPVRVLDAGFEAMSGADTTRAHSDLRAAAATQVDRGPLPPHDFPFVPGPCSTRGSGSL